MIDTPPPPAAPGVEAALPLRYPTAASVVLSLLVTAVFMVLAIRCFRA